MTRVIALAVCSAALLLAGCGERSTSAKPTPTNAAKDDVPELTSMAQLQRAFDAHAGVPRLVILLSPT
jgi:nitrous oxide reductase accessory protein NosL